MPLLTLYQIVFRGMWIFIGTFWNYSSTEFPFITIFQELAKMLQSIHCLNEPTEFEFKKFDKILIAERFLLDIWHETISLLQFSKLSEVVPQENFCYFHMISGIYFYSSQWKLFHIHFSIVRNNCYSLQMFNPFAHWSF